MSINGWMDKENILYRIQQNTEENPVICDNMDGSWGHYAKWNKPDIERQMPYDLTYM